MNWYKEDIGKAIGESKTKKLIFMVYVFGKSCSINLSNSIRFIINFKTLKIRTQPKPLSYGIRKEYTRFVTKIVYL
jgi:hypothetical protein